MDWLKAVLDAQLPRLLMAPPTALLASLTAMHDLTTRHIRHTQPLLALQVGGGMAGRQALLEQDGIQ
jgi:hypothetical protein